MFDRREVLKALIAASVVSAQRASARPATLSDGLKSLVPETPSTAPNYWCTWAVQNYMYGQGLSELDTALLEGDSGGQLAHNAMSETALLGQDGWASNFHARVRGDLYLLLDDGWEMGGTATFQLDPEKFPSFKGSNGDRLRELNREINRLGWRGAALWCRNTPGGVTDLTLESECSKAGIRYWKIDIGDPAFNLVRTRNDARISLTLEHVHGELPVNGDWKREGRFGPQPWTAPRIEILRHTDVYRTYDVTAILSLPTTLDRVSELLRSAAGHPEMHSLLNVEDEVYVAAALGCTMGVMRHSLYGRRPGSDADLFFNGPRKIKQRMDEVVRALRWQRIAAPFASGIGRFETSDEVLTDGWTFARGETWQSELVGATVWQGAPAILARNIELPKVSTEGEKPFVFAARFPGGAVAVGAQERTRPGQGWFMPRCEVMVHAGDAPGPFGIFGEFDKITLNFDKMPAGRRVVAQDLAGDEPVDITSRVEFNRRQLRLSRSLLREVGLRSRTPGDLSSPGLVVTLV